MREILFRGLQMFHENNDWVYGYLKIGDITGKRTAFIIPADFDKCKIKESPVYESTVGQYTGLTDKNGVKIFEGDIVRDITERTISKEKKAFGIAVVKFGKHEVQSDDPFCYGDAYGWYFDGNTVRGNPIQYYGYNEYERDERLQFEVIGNVFDNRLEDFNG